MNWIKKIKLDKNFCHNSLLLFGSVVFALFLAEILLRITLPRQQEIPDYLIRKPDYELGYVLIPGSLPFLDKNGFNNKYIPETSEIVALGDSHTAGIFENGVYHSWPEYLSEITGKLVYNMGVGGYGPVQYFALIDKALEFKPKYLVIGLLLSNDAFDAYNMVYNGYILDKSYYDLYDMPFITDRWREFRKKDFINNQPLLNSSIKKVNVRFGKIRRFLRKNFMLYDFLAERTLIFREKVGLAKPRTIGTNNWRNNDPEVSLRYEDPSIKTLFWVGGHYRGVNLEDKNITEGLRITLELLDRINNKSKAKGVKLIVALIPSKEVVYAPIVGSRVNQNSLYMKMIKDEQIIKEKILEHCDKNKIYCLDMAPKIEEHLRRGVKVYPETWDSHPTPLGYKIYAQIISNAIK